MKQWGMIALLWVAPYLLGFELGFIGYAIWVPIAIVIVIVANSLLDVQKISADSDAIDAVELVREFSVAGVSHRKQVVLKHFSKGTPKLFLMAEPDNQHDKNAIAVYAVSGLRSGLVGYMPKDMAKIISDLGIVKDISVDCLKFWSGDYGGVKIYASLECDKSIIKTISEGAIESLNEAAEESLR
ncbi:HIRAN domain-containing protein [Pontibacter sp. JAM-7]|uniref:HIRAN domain-containing protein n=1 Tax=Pontibacter sp. JAM-7 TaxID=3366581 RepID=UPI003AF67DAA